MVRRATDSQRGAWNALARTAAGKTAPSRATRKEDEMTVKQKLHAYLSSAKKNKEYVKIWKQKKER